MIRMTIPVLVTVTLDTEQAHNLIAGADFAELPDIARQQVLAAVREYRGGIWTAEIVPPRND